MSAVAIKKKKISKCCRYADDIIINESLEM